MAFLLHMLIFLEESVYISSVKANLGIPAVGVIQESVI